LRAHGNLVIGLGLLTLPALALAERATLLRSYWGESGTSIYSDILVEHDDGSSEVVTELGGQVGDIRMVQFEAGGGVTGPTQLDFVRTLNKGKTAPLYWAQSWIFITPDSGGTSDVAGDGELATLTATAEAWNAAVEGCSYMRLKLKPPRSLEVRPDGKNTVKYRHDRWCRPAYGKEPEKCYRPEAAAITTLFHIDNPDNPDNGLVIDADIEVNAVDYMVATGCETACVTEGDRGIVQDLQNTLTHELGHVIGLDHTCWQPGDGAAPLDGEGKPVPSCSSPTLSDEVLDATMYTYQGPRETKKRTPEADDVAGVCAVYPTDQDPMIYEEVDIDSGGCAVGGRGGGAGLGLLGLAGLSARRRRRPRGQGTSL
jgi:MYXO-CTERM domain-containing protein